MGFIPITRDYVLGLLFFFFPCTSWMDYVAVTNWELSAFIANELNLLLRSAFQDYAA